MGRACQPVELLPKDREALVLDNLKLVPFILNKYAHKRKTDSNYEDYYQEGCIGLIKAAQKYDPKLGFSFSTYASNLILNEIRRYRRDRDISLKISRSIIVLIPEYVTLQNQGFNKEQIIDKMNIDHDTYLALLNANSLISLNQRIDTHSDKNNSELEVQDSIPDHNDIYSDALFDMELDEKIEKILLEFNEPHRSLCQEFVYTRLFGEELSQEYFADKYHTSQPHVSRVLRKFKKLLLKELDITL